MLAISTQILPAIATITHGADHVARRGNIVRCYRPEMPELTVASPLTKAVHTLLQAGYTVKVYEGHVIYTPTLDGSTIIWSGRATRKLRASVVVEVTL
jgi:hypothetical protein